MKFRTALAVAMVVGFPALSLAFTLDAVGYGGSELALAPYSVFVPGYGELVFEALDGTSLVVNSAYRNDSNFVGPSLSFDPAEAVKITFNGLELRNVNVDFVGLSVPEKFDMQKDHFTTQSNLVTPQGDGDGAGLYSLSWSLVPEPSSAALGLLGTAALVLRRRR